MRRALISIFSLFVLISLMGCGAKRGNPEIAEVREKNLPVYTYLDNKGNTYKITRLKLHYTPVSVENTVDQLEDQGYPQEIRLSRNEYNLISSVLEQQLNRDQRELPEDYGGYAIPLILKEHEQTTIKQELDLLAVHEINFTLEPFLEDE